MIIKGLFIKPISTHVATTQRNETLSLSSLVRHAISDKNLLN